MSNEISIVSTGIPSTHELAVYQTVAKHASQSNMYRNMGGEAGILMIMLAARELNIPAMQALNGGIHIIQGKVEISARMMNALIRRAGHSLKILESTDSVCTIQGTRKDNGDTGTATYTIADAQKAGLVRAGGGWIKYPGDMCFARALSRLSRQLFADVIGIGYVEGEVSKQEEPEQTKAEVVEFESSIEIPPEQPKKQMISEEAAFNLAELIGDTQEDIDYLTKILSHYKASKLTEIPLSNYAAIERSVKARRQKNEAN